MKTIVIGLLFYAIVIVCSIVIIEGDKKPQEVVKCDSFQNVITQVICKQ